MTGGMVVVLGQTGRNFAAGMSGGVAYVLDEDGSFAQRCNLSMVQLEAVPEEVAASETGEAGSAWPRAFQSPGQGRRSELLARHDREALAASPAVTRAKHILDNWATYLPKFVKVMPTEYRRALAGNCGAASEGGRIMGKPTGFMEFQRLSEGYAPVEQTREELSRVRRASHRCRSQACRAHAAWIAAFRSATTAARSTTSFRTGTIWCIAATGSEALEVLHSTNNFPEVTGRICPAPCEAACTLNINNDAVGIKSIEHAIIDKGGENGWVRAATGDSTRPARKSPSSAPARRAWRPRSNWRASATT